MFGLHQHLPPLLLIQVSLFLVETETEAVVSPQLNFFLKSDFRNSLQHHASNQLMITSEEDNFKQNHLTEIGDGMPEGVETKQNKKKKKCGNLTFWNQ